VDSTNIQSRRGRNRSSRRRSVGHLLFGTKTRQMPSSCHAWGVSTNRAPAAQCRQLPHITHQGCGNIRARQAPSKLRRGRGYATVVHPPPHIVCAQNSPLSSLPLSCSGWVMRSLAANLLASDCLASWSSRACCCCRCCCTLTADTSGAAVWTTCRG
jgi:hypothetical protein